jgi:hypothetical protein
MCFEMGPCSSTRGGIGLPVTTPSRALFSAGLRQHSHSRFRAPFGRMTIFLFFPRYLCVLKWDPPLRREEGLVFL